MEKNKQFYKTIGQVAKEIGLINKKTNKLNTHTLRFWEKNFKQIKPKLFSGNRRYYSKKDIEYLKLIHDLLKKRGFTIDGAKKALADPSLNLDESLFSSLNSKNLKLSVKNKVDKIKRLISKIKRDN